MIEWLNNLWTHCFTWVESLKPRTAVVLGATATAVIGVLWQYVLLPFFRWGVKKLLNKAYPMISGAIVIDRFWSLPKYLKALNNRVLFISNPWLEEGQKLADIFVPVSVTTRIGKSERIDLNRLFQNHRAFVVIGGPGSEKTTGLKSIAVGCINRRVIGPKGQFLIPVILSLRRLAQAKKSLDDFIIEEFAALNFPNAGRLIRKLESTGRLVFLLDGLDEADENDRPAVLEKIRGLLERQQHGSRPCHVVITTRPVGYDEQLRGNVDETVHMADFTLAEIRKFVSNWEFRPPKSRERLMGAITDRRPIFDICKNPLMLTIVTSLYRDYDYTLPDSREEFYRVCVDALLRRWDEARSLEDRNKIQASYKQAFLEEFSFQAIEQSLLDFKEDSVITGIETFLTRRNYKGIEAPRFLLEILRSGLLTRLPTGEILFPHKTFAESMAASHLRNQAGRLIELWKQKPDTWLEVASLFVADPKTLANDITKLLDASRSVKNWNGFLTLAGEAHSCPEKDRRWILEELLEVEIWATLDSRAVQALARLSSGAPQLLKAMVHSENMHVRTRAIHSLGSVPEPWAVQLLSELLLSGRESTETVSALASMGADGISVIASLIDNNSKLNDIIGPCLEVLEQIGDLQALETAIPLIWSKDSRVCHPAALSCACMLKDSGLCASFEALDGENCPPLWVSETRNTGTWATPWLSCRQTRQRACYSRIIDLIAEMMKQESRLVLKRAATATARLVVPAAIKLNDASIDISRMYIDRPRRSHINFHAKIVDAEDHTFIAKVFSIVSHRSFNANQKLWGRIGIPDRQNIEVTNEKVVSVALWLLTIVYILPSIFSVLLNRLTPWWLSGIGSLWLITIGYSIKERDWGGFAEVLPALTMVMWFVAAEMRCGRNFFKKVQPVGLVDSLLLTLIMLAGIAIFFIDCYSIWMLKGYWWLCILAGIPIALWFDGGDIVFIRRENPFSDLLRNIDTTV